MRARHVLFLLLGACVTGGMFGALANSAALWGASDYGVMELAGVGIYPEHTWAWLRPRVVWGAIWGAGFTPLAWVGPRRLFSLALLYSLIPSAVQLFYVFPVLQGKGTLGTSLGELTPAFVVGANAIYALVMAVWVRLSVAAR